MFGLHYSRERTWCHQEDNPLGMPMVFPAMLNGVRRQTASMGVTPLAGVQCAELKGESQQSTLFVS